MHNNSYFTVKTALTQAYAQAQAKAQGSNFFRFLVLARMLAFALQQEDEMPLRHNTSKRVFTTRGYVWPMKTLDPDCLAPKQFGKFGWFCLYLCLCRISFSLGSFLLLALVLASLVKTRLMSVHEIHDVVRKTKGKQKICSSEKTKMEFKQEMAHRMRFIKSPCVQVRLGTNKLHQGCAPEAPKKTFTNRQLTFAYGRLEKLIFSCKLKCWAPRISWSGTFELSQILFTPQPCCTYQRCFLKLEQFLAALFR